MAVFDRLSKEQIKKEFDHYGLMFGVVPIYVGDVDGQCRVAVRNWVPEWTLDLVEAIVCAIGTTWVNEQGEPLFAIKKTKPIE